MQKILKTYLRRLTNLTSRNKSLLLLSLPQEQFFDLHELNFLNGESSYNLVNQLIAQKKQIKLCDVIDPRFEKVNEASKRLRKLARTEQMIEEERGANDLYVGFPFVKGKLLDGTVVRCPLLFFPVSLTQKDNHWLLEKREEAIAFNRSFLLAYSHFNQINVSDEWLEFSFEDFEKNSLAFRTQLYETLKNSSFEINFNQDLFQDQLAHFERFSKTDLEQAERQGELKLYPQAVLGIFPQGGSFLVNDYEKLIENTANNEVFEDIFNGKVWHTSNINEANTILPFSVDASQELAIRSVKSGKSVVIQGPPGTGKSQLICNLISDFTAQGKRVLVVCQKRVALDTVYARLQSIGMTDFVGLVHDFKNDRKLLFEKIANQIESVEAYKKQNQSLDAIVLERNFTQISRRIDQICQELEGFKAALYDDSIGGVSIKELYLTSNPIETILDLSDVYKQFKINELESFLEKLKRYFEYENLLRKNEIYEFWKHRNSFHNFTFQHKKEIQQTIEDVVKFNSELPHGLTISDFEDFDESIINNFLQNIENQEVVGIFFEMLEKNKYQQNRQFDLKKIYAELNEVFENGGIEKSISNEELQIRKIQINNAYKASLSFVEWQFWKLFSKDKQVVNSIIINNKFQLQTSDLKQLSIKIENRIRFEEIADKLAKKEIFVSHQEATENILQTIKNHISASEAKEIFENDLSFKKLPISEWRTFEVFQKSFHKIIQKIQETKQNLAVWLKFLSKKQIAALCEAHLEDVPHIAFLNTNFDLLHEQDFIRFSFTHSEQNVVEKIESAKIQEPQKALEIFQNSIRLAWIQDIESKYPMLRGVSSLKIKHLEEELQELLQKKQALSQEILLLKLREQTYKELIINRLQNVTSYRELFHQTTKKRKIWSVRKVLEQYSDEVFKLIPCWMASPESVSAVFHLTPQPPLLNERGSSLFDLVIFDEASQCYAEHGIPAIFRGKQVVIAGDSKQLQPSDLYQIRYEDNTEEEPVLEIDSLLDLAAQYLPQNQLQGHYRSHSLDLIDFSNQYFYKNSLRLLPHFQEINKKQPSINYIKVDGFWERNANETEAYKVVELVSSIIKKEENKSIGIVTFNYLQADLIDEILQTSSIKHQTVATVASNLAVKNIENIQGDEFDIVIFSIGYAPDTKGRMLMNFGSLNQKGGENRLNVAITRAKEKIFVVSSILPEQLRVEDSANEGPKILKKYLSYALEVSNGNYTPKPLETTQYRTDWLLKNKIREMRSEKREPSTEYREAEVQNLNISNLESRISNLKKELPFADLTVKSNETYESLLLTDDDLYFSATSKESHGYLPLNLREKGWHFSRIWSREFWQNH